MEYRFLVIGDEYQGRDYVTALIREFMPGAAVWAAAAGDAAAVWQAAGGADIVFLDLDPDHGFGVLQSLPARDFELICLSAQSRYALDAIREGVAGYLLKPLRRPAFRDALQRATEQRSRHLAGSRGGHGYLERKVAIPHQQGIWFITLADIVYLRAENSYTIIYLAGGQKITTSRPISRFEQTLEMPWFFRIHKSYIINTSQLKAYLSGSSGAVLMSNDDRLLISRYRLARFQEIMKQIGDEVK